MKYPNLFHCCVKIKLVSFTSRLKESHVLIEVVGLFHKKELALYNRNIVFVQLIYKATAAALTFTVWNNKNCLFPKVTFYFKKVKKEKNTSPAQNTALRGNLKCIANDFEIYQNSSFTCSLDEIVYLLFRIWFDMST